eukprot:TRINITY_DN3595_c0_g1_i4.p1 TRINITY_DN3595_c0_g1~~TRINITY_DN3595_c0_g1_i4.p1  ORF type:complete len:334 (-),score=26.60 TRINITY_DN3595_c0_g1_i4:152-1153(-)
MATAHLRGCIWNSSKVSACTRKKLQKNSCRVDFKVQATGSQPSVQQKMILTEKQVAQFYKEGFLVLPKFASKEQCDKMKHAAISIAKEMGLEAEKKASIFSTKNQTEKSDQYFLDSANNISLFFEEDAFSETGQQLAIDRRINKIGHALHDLHPIFKEFSRSNKISDILQSLGYQRPIPVQSMYIFKQPKIGGEVVAHQDSTFLRTLPEDTCIGVWIALEKATIENGCLFALPNSHQNGVQKRFVLVQGKVQFEGQYPKLETDNFIPLEMERGDMVLLHGANFHRSSDNTSPQSRHAYSVHFVEGAQRFWWSEQNWLQRSEQFPFLPLYDKQD